MLNQHIRINQSNYCRKIYEKYIYTLNNIQVLYGNLDKCHRFKKIDY